MQDEISVHNYTSVSYSWVFSKLKGNTGFARVVSLPDRFFYNAAKDKMQFSCLQSDSLNHCMIYYYEVKWKIQ